MTAETAIKTTNTSGMRFAGQKIFFRSVDPGTGRSITERGTDLLAEVLILSRCKTLTHKEK